MFAKFTATYMAQIPNDLIIRFINNECSDEELVTVRNWLDESEENVIELFETERAAHHAALLREDDVQRKRLEKKFHDRVAIEERDRKRRRRHRFALWTTGAAASIAIVFIAGFLFMHVPKVKMKHIAATEESVSLLLSDSTRVYLNKNSSLTYPEVFAEDSREVELRGEGYFEVAHDSKRPFRVAGEYLRVEVLGTRFNFESKDENSNSVSLLEGSVAVFTPGEGSGVVIEPGQKALYSVDTGRLTVQNTNAAVDASWHNRIIPFHNASIKEIIEILRQLYDRNIELDSNVDLKKTYSGVTVYCEDLDSTLARLANTIPIRFVTKDDIIVIYSR
ncbi:MAG: FecR domain-containing protein [Muribaculaceae bacterium]|nr:FecR domain-containing protein [Muribaculaceae bacterium]